MKDFVKGLAISQLIPKKKFNELVRKWHIDKGVTKLHTQKLLEVLILSSVYEKQTLRDAEDSYGIPKSTLDDALKNVPAVFSKNFVHWLSMNKLGLLKITSQ